MPIIKSDGSYFGNLCAIDPAPHEVCNAKTLALFQGFADLTAQLLELDDRRSAAESALLDAAETAELRDQFMAVLGHDLRNPLASLSATGEILVRRSDEPDVRTAVARIRSATKRMSGLISDVMDFARGRMGGGLDASFASIHDFEDALGDVIGEPRLAHPERRITEQLRIAEAVYGNRGRLQQVLSDLLGNAIAHGSADAPIKVGASIHDGWLFISVRNWGDPIPTDNLPKIFQPYWRPSESREREGLGLGLHICSMIVKSHGGQLQVSSTAEHGPNFLVRLPTRPGITAIA